MGTIYFATTGYKDILWRTDKSKVTAGYWKNYIEEDNNIVYSKFNFDGVTLKMIFYFENNKLSGWNASGTIENSESEKLVNQYKKNMGLIIYCEL